MKNDARKIQLLHQNSIRDPSTGCRVWQMCKDKDGYGTTYFRDKNWRAHRVIYTLLVGEIPPGLVVRHTCDNPSCIEIEHLLLGTPQDNDADRVARNRQAKGERHGRSKLTTKDIFAMVELRKNGLSYTRIAAQFGVKKSTAMDAIKGKIWKHLPLLYTSKELAFNKEWRGEKTSMAKLTEKDIHNIRNWQKEGFSHQKIADILHVSSSMIGKILRNEAWKHIA